MLTGACLLAAVSFASAVPECSYAQRDSLSATVRAYVRTEAPVVALTHVRVIDGTGAPVRADQTVIIRDATIVAMGNDGTVAIPNGAFTMDLAGKSITPGFVMVHEHLYYPTGPGVYAFLAESFTRLYLAGGVTSMRTGGNMNGYGELAIANAIARGRKPGPWIDATAPYLEGAGLGLGQVHELGSAADATTHVNFWADQGATSFKAYMHITRDELGAAVRAAHARHLKVTGHLCSVTYREAAELGIDNLEHGFLAATDFVAGKTPDVCPGQGAAQASIAALDVNSDAVKSLIAELIRKKVALTSTLTVFETFTPGRPTPPGTDVLEPQLKDQLDRSLASVARAPQSLFATLFPKGMALELAFARAGGLLVAGTDPTGFGGVIPGYSNQREVELLVEAGFTPLEAIRIATLNGATYLGLAARVGSIAVGKQADLIVFNGDPSAKISDIRNVELVVKQGVFYDPAKLINSVKGRVGLF